MLEVSSRISTTPYSKGGNVYARRDDEIAF